MSKLYYMDGKPYNPPKNPLKEKWDKFYPSIPIPEFSQVCDGYSCMWCGRCPKGDNWKVPQSDIEEYDKWKSDLDKYHEENGNIEELILTCMINNINMDEFMSN